MDPILIAYGSLGAVCMTVLIISLFIIKSRDNKKGIKAGTWGHKIHYKGSVDTYHTPQGVQVRINNLITSAFPETSDPKIITGYLIDISTNTLYNKEPEIDQLIAFRAITGHFIEKLQESLYLKKEKTTQEVVDETDKTRKNKIISN